MIQGLVKVEYNLKFGYNQWFFCQRQIDKFNHIFIKVYDVCLTKYGSKNDTRSSYSSLQYWQMTIQLD